MKQTISAPPERRNPQLATAEGSEGRASEFTAPMCGHSNSHTFQLSTPSSLISQTVAAKMRSRVRYPRVDVCLNCKQVGVIHNCKGAGSATTQREVKSLTQPGGSLIQAKLIGQTSSYPNDPEQASHLIRSLVATALDKIDESLTVLPYTPAGLTVRPV